MKYTVEALLKQRFRGSLLLLLFMANEAWAAAQNHSSSSIAAHTEHSISAANGAQSMLSVALGLVGIIALILLLAWIAKKAGGGSWMRSPYMSVVASMPLGTRERLMLIDVAGTQILLGVTAHNVNQLHVFNEPIITHQQRKPSDFSQKLMSIMNHHKNRNDADKQNDQQHSQ